MNLLLKFSNQMLSPTQMKNVKGGSSFCSCHCNGHAGAWEGVYNTSNISQAVANYCDSSGGTCQCNPIEEAD